MINSTVKHHFFATQCVIDAARLKDSKKNQPKNQLSDLLQELTITLTQPIQWQWQYHILFALHQLKKHAFADRDEIVMWKNESRIV